MRACVIGHGPSPTGWGWGKRIDDCDAVIRMWECGWQDPADYGSRYDHGVLNTARTADGRRALVEHGRHPQPREWWLYGPPVGPERADLNRPARAINLPAIDGRSCTGKPATPSRGLAAVAAALAWLEPDELVLVGFDSVTAGAIPAREYAEDFAAVLPEGVDWRNDGVRTYAHDFGAERDWIARHRCVVPAEGVWG